MSDPKNRLLAVWASHEQRARVWFRLFVFGGGLLVLSLLTTFSALGRPREVVRIGCDGIPQVVRLDDRAYSEPDEREIRAFAGQFAVLFMRADSYSVVNDYVWCAARMAPELQEAFKREARNATAVVEALKRRTEIEPASLEIQVDKRLFPWRASVKGARRVIGTEDGQGREEAFALDVEVVRTERTVTNPFGLLVWRIHTGDSGASPKTGQ